MKFEKRNKFLESPYNPKRTWVRRIPGVSDEEEFDQSKQLLASAKKVEEVVSDISPRTLVYHAKYSKYKINKKLNKEFEDSKYHK